MTENIEKFFDERSYYEEKLRRDPSTVFWRSPSGAKQRYDAVLRHVNLSTCSVIDIGCGRGDFVDHAMMQDIRPISYWGIDIVPEFINDALKRGVPGKFEIGDVVESGFGGRSADWIVAIGLFGHRQPAGMWNARFEKITEAMWRACRLGIALTLTSTASPQRHHEAHYVDPDQALHEARVRFGGHAMIDHSYLPNDFLLIARRN
jgi:SAM-dependent methyltransferase